MNWNPNGAAERPDIADLRAELADLMPFLNDEDGLQPDHLRDLSARVAELVARIGDEP